MTKIALITTSDRANGVYQTLDLLGENPVNGKDVVLKPNFNTADPPPGSTGTDTLRALVLKLREMGAASITVAERAGPPDTQEVMKEKGVFELAKELNFPLVNLDTLSIKLDKLGPKAQDRPGASIAETPYRIVVRMEDCLNGATFSPSPRLSPSDNSGVLAPTF